MTPTTTATKLNPTVYFPPRTAGPSGSASTSTTATTPRQVAARKV